MHAITKLQNVPRIEIQNYFQNMFRFYDSLYGLGKRAYIDVHHGDTYPEKN